MPHPISLTQTSCTYIILKEPRKKKSFQVQHQRPAIEPALGSVGSWVGSAPGESTPAPTILLPISSLPL